MSRATEKPRWIGTSTHQEWTFTLSTPPMWKEPAKTSTLQPVGLVHAIFNGLLAVPTYLHSQHANISIGGSRAKKSTVNLQLTLTHLLLQLGDVLPLPAQKQKTDQTIHPSQTYPLVVALAKRTIHSASYVNPVPSKTHSSSVTALHHDKKHSYIF